MKYSFLAAVLSLTPAVEFHYVNRVVYRVHTTYQPTTGFEDFVTRERTIELYHYCWLRGRTTETIDLEDCDQFPIYDRKGPHYLITIRTEAKTHRIKTRSLTYRETERRMMH